MSSNGEIIHLHVGQAGVQIASACWELYCLEHGITSDGCMRAPDYINDNSFTTLFSYSCSHKLVPRLVMVDSEPTVIDEVRTGAYGHLFKPETLVSGKEDSGSNFARGYNTIGSELVDVSVDAIRGVVEECSNLKGVILFRAIGGGTGSGLGNRIMERLADELGKKTKLDFIIFPSPSLSPLIVEPYNSLLATHIGMDSSNCTFIMDNEALYNICESKLGVCSPTYTNLNRIVAQATSALTASQRFDGSMNVSFSELQTNLVPYPRIHFPLVSYAPLVTMGGACYSEFNTEKLTLECFQPSSQLVRCNPAEGKYMSCVLLYRGNVKPVDINSSIKILKSRNSVQFVDWSPTGFKIGINSMPPYSVLGGDIGPTDQAMVGVANNTIIHKAWCRLLHKFNQLYKRRAFVHHYASEGLEESVFVEASEDICTLISDYREVQTKIFEGKRKSVDIDTLDHVQEVKDEDLVGFPMSRTPWRPRLKSHIIEAKSDTSEEDQSSDIDEDDPYHIESSNYEYETTEEQKNSRKQTVHYEPSTFGLKGAAADRRKPHPSEIEYKSSTQSVYDEMDSQEKADKSASPTLDQVDCHFLIYGNCHQGIPLRKSTSELIHKHSTLGCHFKIQNGVCQVVENDQQPPDLTNEVSTGITKLQCYLNLCDKTCHCTIGQDSSIVPIEGAVCSSKTELRQLECDKT